MPQSFTASLTDLVLEQVTQRLDDFLKVNVVGQTADVVVALDRGRFAAEAGLDHVGVNRALCQKVHSTDLFGLILKDADELLADDLALALGGVLTSQLLVEAVTGIDASSLLRN